MKGLNMPPEIWQNWEQDGYNETTRKPRTSPSWWEAGTVHDYFTELRCTVQITLYHSSYHTIWVLVFFRCNSCFHGLSLFGCIQTSFLSLWLSQQKVWIHDLLCISFHFCIIWLLSSFCLLGQLLSEQPSSVVTLLWSLAQEQFLRVTLEKK